MRLGIVIAVLVALLAGCDVRSPGPLAPTTIQSRAAASSQQYVFVTNLLGNGEQNSEIAYWPVGATGNAAPAGVIYGSATGLDGPAGIVVTPAGEILVSNSQTNSILGFAAGSSGNVAPNVVISGPETRIDHPTGLAEDEAGDLFVSNCAHGCGTHGAPSIAEFAANANGDVAPTRVIQGRRTTLVKPHALAVSRGGEIYVVDIGPPSKLSPHVEVFGADASGDRAPSRVIEGGKTKLYHTGGGIALDPHGFYIGNWSSPFIERFAFLANGDARPRSFIRGSKTQLECCLDGIGPWRDRLVVRGGARQCVRQRACPRDRSVRQSRTRQRAAAYEHHRLEHRAPHPAQHFRRPPALNQVLVGVCSGAFGSRSEDQEKLTGRS